MLCSVWDFALGEEGLGGVLDTDFSCCGIFDDIFHNNVASADNNKQKWYLELYTMWATFGLGEGQELRTMT